MNVKENVEKYIRDVGVPITVFVKKVGISPSSYYRWMHGELKLSDEKVEKIEAYIKKYGF